MQKEITKEARPSTKEPALSSQLALCLTFVAQESNLGERMISSPGETLEKAGAKDMARVPRAPSTRPD